MNRPRAVVLGVASVLVCCTALGCGRDGSGGGGGGGAGSDPTATTELGQIGRAYHAYLDERRNGPPDADALRPYLGGNTGPYQGLKDGRYVFVWNARFADNPDTHEVVLAYQKDVPTQGGPVLFMDASTKDLTVEQFKAARMAKAKS